jgi:hypothetical protein
VSGGIVNGKTTIVERANDVISRGYSANYYTNSTGDIVLAASVLRLANGSFEVDTELPTTTWLNKLRYSKEWTRVPVSVSAYMQLNGERYLMSAHVSQEQHSHLMMLHVQYKLLELCIYRVQHDIVYI